MTRFACLFVALTFAACAKPPEARTANEASAPPGLRYVTEVDATRLERGTGLRAVASVQRLVEDELAPFFRTSVVGAATTDRVVLLAESPAPGFAVRVPIEARPDDFCVVSFEIVRVLDGGRTESVSEAPFSLHYALTAVRNAFAALRPVDRPAMDAATFAILRQQASQALARGEDPPIDEVTYIHTPRPLERSDEPPHYVAPVNTRPSTLRGDPTSPSE